MRDHVVRWLLGLGVMMLYASIGMPALPTGAQPEVAGAPVDLVDVEPIYGGQQGVPGDPGQSFQAWIEVKNLTGQNQFVLEQIIESQSDAILLERAFWISASASDVWLPGWVFKSDPDSMRVKIWYWDYGINGWSFADRAIGWLPADLYLQGNPGHWPWSPNMYKQLRRWSSPDPNYHWVEIRFWYFDNARYGGRFGTDRLNRMKAVTNANAGLWGTFQGEFRRTDTNQQAKEGWDAQYELSDPSGCVALDYGYDTNLPQAITNNEELGPICGLVGDEEAEVTTTHTEDMSAYLGQDPTNIHLQQTAPFYRYSVRFYRRPANQGQSFRLHTEFEMLDDAPDLAFDVEVPIRYNWTY